MGDLSEYFSRAELACKHCRALPAGAQGLPALVEGLEELRKLAYPRGLVIASGYRCPAANASLPHAAKGSQHLYAAAADVPLVAELGAVVRLRVFSGIGWQMVGSRKLVRHVDVRHASGHNTTGGSVRYPTLWEYFADGSRR